jgi:hypothetical protein
MITKWCGFGLSERIVNMIKSTQLKFRNYENKTRQNKKRL